MVFTNKAEILAILFLLDRLLRALKDLSVAVLLEERALQVFSELLHEGVAGLRLLCCRQRASGELIVLVDCLTK